MTQHGRDSLSCVPLAHKISRRWRWRRNPSELLLVGNSKTNRTMSIMSRSCAIAAARSVGRWRRRTTMLLGGPLLNPPSVFFEALSGALDPKWRRTPKNTAPPCKLSRSFLHYAIARLIERRGTKSDPDFSLAKECLKCKPRRKSHRLSSSTSSEIEFYDGRTQESGLN